MRQGNLEKKRLRLLSAVERLKSCAVAFSGGVDSAVVAQAAQLTLGDRAVAVTAVSASLARGEREVAQRVANAIGIRHVEVKTDELSNPAYVQNGPNRCFHCKTELYRVMASRLSEWNVEAIANGANLDDRGDYRPGMQAATNANVVSPLIEAELTKQDVRELAAAWQLEVADKPATPCLSSRIAYGESVSPERLMMVEAGENWLRDRGMGDVRVRWHGGELARIELPSEVMSRAMQPAFYRDLVEAFKELGFQFVTLDLEGRRTGSLNVLVNIEL